MVPIKQIGPTQSVTAAATGAVTNPSEWVLVTNTGATVGYFSAMLAGETQPASGVGVPVQQNAPQLIAISENTTAYGVQGATLLITPVAIPRFNS